MVRVGITVFVLGRIKLILSSACVLVVAHYITPSQINPYNDSLRYQQIWDNARIAAMNTSIMDNNIFTAGAYGRLREEQLKKKASPEMVALKRKGAERIRLGKANTTFPLFSTSQAINSVLSRYKDGIVSRSVQRIGSARLAEDIKQLQKEMTDEGYKTNDISDTFTYTSGIIYESDFGTFPPSEQIEVKREWLRKLYLEGDLLQGSYEHFDWQAARAMAGAALARKARKTVETSSSASEIEQAIDDLEFLEQLFQANMADDIYSFASKVANVRGQSHLIGSSFERRKRELARGWYEKEYARKFGRTDLDYAVLLKEFDSVVEELGESTNDMTSAELACAALVYEVYLDSVKSPIKLNANHLRDLREMIANNNRQPFISEMADIWRQRWYERLASQGMFINKAYFSAQNPQQRKALADESFNVLKMVFRNYGIENYRITEDGIVKR